jgi:hypothetical protein
VANPPQGCLPAAFRGKVEGVTAEPIHAPKVMPVPAATPAAIRAVLVNADEPELLEWFTKALDRAVAEAKESGSVEPLNAMLKEWRLRASEWCDPVKQKALVAQMEDWRVNGVPDDQRADPDEVLAIFEAKGVSGPALDKLRSLAARR